MQRVLILILSLSLLLPAAGITGNVALGQQVGNVTTAVAAADTTENFEDFDPGLGIFALVVICVLLFVAFLFFALAAVCILLFLGAIAVGIISASVAVGIAQRSFSKGLRMLLVLGSGFCGLLVGTFGCLLANDLFHLHFSRSEAIGMGALGGLAGGLVIGYTVYRTILMTFRYLKKKYRDYLQKP